MQKIKQWFFNFMSGRYGTDKLNMVILWTGVFVMLISLFIPNSTVRVVFSLIYYALLIWALFRCFSRQTYKRYQENRKFLSLVDRIKDRQHRYFNCPKCRQTVRVPRRKGKISITCPKCGEKFIKKT